jgi:hypothetical protein
MRHRWILVFLPVAGELLMSENFRLPTGKFRGVLITRVPPGYLRWMISSGHVLWEFAKKELDRRGSEELNIEVTAHAIDRASCRLIDKFMAEASPQEGIWTWLAKKAEEALAKYDGMLQDNIQVLHEEVVYVFEMKFVVPVLTSVWIIGQKEEA